MGNLEQKLCAKQLRTGDCSKFHIKVSHPNDGMDVVERQTEAYLVTPRAKSWPLPIMPKYQTPAKMIISLKKTKMKSRMLEYLTIIKAQIKKVSVMD